MDFTQVLKENTMDLNMQAKNKDEALGKLMDLLDNAGVIKSKEGFLKDVMAREAEGSTGIGNFIAIPHGKSEHVEKISVAFGKLTAPIPWETLDGKPVKVIFLFAVPNDDNTNQNHLKLLSQLATTLAHEESQEQLLAAKDKEEVFNIFQSK